MGSFNTFCMVSHQVITPGAKVVLLPIEQQSTYRPVEISKNGEKQSQYGFAHTTCYPTAFWGYSGPMIRAQYDDYGRFKIEKTSANEANMLSFFCHLLRDSFKTQQGENKSHDHAFDMKQLFDEKKSYSFKELENIWDDVWKVMQENRLFVANYQGEPRNLQCAVIHQAAAEHLIERVNSSISHNGQSYEKKAYFTRYVQGYLTRLVERFKDKNKPFEDMFLFFSTQIASLSSYGVGEQENCHLSHHYNNWNAIMDTLESFMKDNPDARELSEDVIHTLFEHFQPQIEHRYLHTALDWFDLKLSPMIYASQDYDNRIGKDYAKLVKTISERVNKEIKANRD